LVREQVQSHPAGRNYARSASICPSKRHKKKIYGLLRKHLGDILDELAKKKESKIGERLLQVDFPY